MRILTILLFALLVLVVASPASAAPVPDSAVHLRIITRDDTGFVVEVTNPSNDVAPFDAIGLYLVPESSGGEQRLGVVSAGQVTADGTWVDAPGVINVAPRGTIRVKLTAYCLDQHRAAPNAKTQYHLASQRMPTELTKALEGAARTVASLGYDPEGAVGHPTPQMAASYYVHNATQQALWRVREAMPVALIGDGASTARASSTSFTAPYRYLR
jgi:hypothetical protein